MNKYTHEHNLVEALIFDLDGVVTTTRELHLKTWERLFGSLFERRGEKPDFKNQDYDLYVDGKPRLEGIRSFLASRDIDIPPGDEDDPPGYESIHGMGAEKNRLFHIMLEQEGVRRYEDAVHFIRKWKQQSMPTAIVSSSKNCQKILDMADLTALFDVRVDGLVAKERGLKGKPSPDIFLEAASRLGVRPEQTIVFEDAISGVEAARAGLFGLVAGVARFENANDLLSHGADLTLEDFSGFDLLDDKVLSYFRAKIPHALNDQLGVFPLLKLKKPVFFLDYDGTLTPIVQKPEDAILDDGMRQVLEKLADRFTVSIVTGRDKEDVEAFVRLDNVVYSGSHGYVVAGPENLHMEHEQSEQIIALMDQVEGELNEALKDMDSGIQLDRKRYAIALHYRNAAKESVPRLFKLVEDFLEKYDKLKRGEGKKVVELKPALDWHKGKAVQWILEALGLDKRKDMLPIYIGDDITDEDAFEALKDLGAGILVEDRGQHTAASFYLKDVYQVRRFFEMVLEQFNQQ